MQLTTDGNNAYPEAVEDAFGADMDHAMLVKLYGQPAGREHERRYSPPECIGIDVRRGSGYPDPDHISTSYVERHNLTMRMGMRRFTRLTNGFSKKIENRLHMLSLYFVHYNFCRIHKSLRTTPAMAAKVTDTLRDMEWIVREWIVREWIVREWIVSLIDARAPKPNRPKTYRRQISN